MQDVYPTQEDYWIIIRSGELKKIFVELDDNILETDETFRFFS